MSKKDYELIASTVKEVLSEYQSGSLSTVPPLRVVENMAYRLAEELAGDNPRFDADCFLTACGI